MDKKVTIVGAGNVGATAAQRVFDKGFADVVLVDIVDGLARLMRAKPDVFLVNLGSDEAVKMVDVANYIINITHSSSKIVFHEPLTFLTEKGIPDLQKVKKALEWIPLVRLEDGLRQAVDYTIANKEIIG